MKRIVLSAIFFAALGANGASALYCGSALVAEGENKFVVLQKCGQPSYSDTRFEFLPTGAVLPYGANGFPYGPNGYYRVGPLQPVTVDEWVYNFGPTQLMPRLLFRDGVLVKIAFLGYGS